MTRPNRTLDQPTVPLADELDELARSRDGLAFVYEALARLALRHRLRDAVIVLEAGGTSQVFRLDARPLSPFMAARLSARPGLHCDPPVIPEEDRRLVVERCARAIARGRRRHHGDVPLSSSPPPNGHAGRPGRAARVAPSGGRATPDRAPTSLDPLRSAARGAPAPRTPFADELDELARSRDGLAFVYEALARLALRHRLRDAVIVLEAGGTSQVFRLDARPLSPFMAARLSARPGLHCDPPVIPEEDRRLVVERCARAIAHGAVLGPGEIPLDVVEIVVADRVDSPPVARTESHDDAARTAPALEQDEVADDLSALVEAAPPASRPEPAIAGLEIAGFEVAGLEVAGLEVAGLEVADDLSALVEAAPPAEPPRPVRGAGADPAPGATRHGAARQSISIVLTGIDVVALVLDLAGVHDALRFVAGLAFGLLVPGWAVVGWLRLRSAALEVGLTLAASATLVMLGAQVLITLHLWHLVGFEVVLGGLCATSLLAQAILPPSRGESP